MTGQASQDAFRGLSDWVADRALRHIDEQQARFSRGLLRSRPEKWFPGLSAHWLPLIHSLGCEFKVIEVKPLMSQPTGKLSGFVCSVDEELLGLVSDEASIGVLLEAVAPGGSPPANSIVAEYLARRFIASLAACWSGPESSMVRFETEIDCAQVRGIASVKLSLEVNGAHCTVWVILGKLLVERMDGLWRRQVRSGSRQIEQPQDIHLELAQLAIPPAMLVEYLKSDNIIDLEIPVSDAVTLRQGGRPWLPARLCIIEGKFGVEILAGPVSGTSLPDGSTRMSVEMGKLILDAGQLSEVSQIGACFSTGIPVSNDVQLTINAERVGDGRLYVYEGRFAVKVS